MLKIGSMFLFFILFMSSASALQLPPYKLPATINGITYQHGAIQVDNNGNGTVRYYNQTPGQQLYGCTMPLNPTAYTPYNRWDVWFTESTFCSFNSSTTDCIWNTASNSNVGMGTYNFLNGDGGQAYSDMDWVNTDSGLCYQGTLKKPANWDSLIPNNLDGTVTIKTTGLTWMRCALGQTWTGSTCSGTASTYTYDQALALTSNYAGYSDWRLPNIAELHTIVERENYSPTINTHLFPNTPNSYFWSSSPNSASTSGGWFVWFDDGSDHTGIPDSFVRLVRGGLPFVSFPLTTPDSDFINNQDGTVIHIRTGLIWQRCAVGQTWTGSSCSGTASTYTYDQALALTSAFTGHKDWRIPNQNELLSIVEYGTYNPAINLAQFPNTPTNDYFLSSTHDASIANRVWIVSFYNGNSGFINDSSSFPGSFPVRLVRSGQTLAPPPSSTYGIASPTSPSGSAAEPVNTATGNYYYQHTDLSMAGRGLPFAFSRTYNAQDSYSGPLGRGWTHSYNLRLTANPDGSVTIKQGDGHEEFYDPDGTGGYMSRYAGLYSRLVKNQDNSYALTTKERTVYIFAADGKLTAIADKNGNPMSFAYDGAGDLTTITDTAGRTVTLSIDANHRITALTDPLGRKVQFAYDADGQLISDTDALGAIQTYSYDAGHSLSQITDRRGHVLVNNTYDAANRVVTQANGRGFTTTFAYDAPNAGDTTITDALGHATIHTHDDLRRLVKETDPLGHSTQFVYDANNNRTKVTGKNGEITQYVYDARGNVTTKIDALGHLTAIAYDTLDNPTQRTDALGGVTLFLYDGNGNLTQSTDALGHVSRISYNAHGQPLTSIDALGRITAYAYDAQGNLIKTTDALGGETLYNYDVIGRRTGITAANGAVTTFTYDANDRLTSSIDSLDGVTLYSYDANDNRTGMTDVLGRITAIAYNENDLPVSVTDALGGVTAYSYDAADNRIAETDPRGNTTQSGYDAANRRISMTDALGHVTALAYDAQDNLTGITNPLGHTTAFAYDALNRRVSSTDGLGHATQTAYDALGRVTQSTDANGRMTHFVYDTLGHLTQSTDALGGKVDYSYDAVGNRTAMTEPNGNTTVYVYDALNHLIKEADPLGHAYQYAYDAVGNVSQRSDALDRETAYSYDANNRLTAIQYPDASTVSFTYDALGNRTLMTDSVGQTQFSYDALGRLTQHTGPFGKAVGYAYDAGGNLQTLTYPGNKTVTYGYDAISRMQSVTDWLGNMAGYSYDAAGNLSAANNPNGTQAVYSYDNAERLTQLVNRKPGNLVLANYSLTLDAVGNRTAIDKTEPLAGLFTANTSTYDYDPANRVTAENGQPLSHDANGNLAGKGGVDFSFDFDNRLTGTGSTSYRYDGLGHRLETNHSSATTRYVHDFAHALPQVLMETNSAGDPQAYYVYGLGLVSRITADNSVRYYHYDTLGSTVALTDNSGNITDRYAYDPFGQVMSMQQSTANPFRYVGQFGVMDDDTGLSYMRARYYSASLGRFISKDPLAGNLADGQSLNRYAYGLNNPVRFVDVSGLSAREGGIVLGASTESSDQAHNRFVASPKVQQGNTWVKQAFTGTAKFFKWAGKKATGILSVAEKVGDKSYGTGPLSAGYKAVDMYETHVENQALVKSGEVAKEYSNEREVVNHLFNFLFSVGVGGEVDQLSGGAAEKKTMKTLDTTVFNRARDVCLQAGEAANCLQ